MLTPEQHLLASVQRLPVQSHSGLAAQQHAHAAVCDCVRHLLHARQSALQRLMCCGSQQAATSMEGLTHSVWCSGPLCS